MDLWSPLTACCSGIQPEMNSEGGCTCARFHSTTSYCCPFLPLNGALVETLGHTRRSGGYAQDRDGMVESSAEGEGAT